MKSKGKNILGKKAHFTVAFVYLAWIVSCFEQKRQCKQMNGYMIVNPHCAWISLGFTHIQLDAVGVFG